jgi:nitrite reductase/ring-hydroxylating ferredoxin subunit/DMSO/TMAO reductase YedYZ heme-binding membrane subunit
MSVGFKAVQWNQRKLVYDAILIACVAAFIATFMTIGALRNPPANAPEWIGLRIKAFGTCAFTMLTIILMIGPLARLDKRFLVLLYNRRHFGVLTFLVALVHAYSVVDWFSAQGAMGDLIAEMTSSPKYGQFIGFPIKALGLTGLTIMFLLAATSHDFWLAFLTPRIWKALHMALYVAYGVLVMHVALGLMQDDRRAFIPILLGGSFALVTALHLAAAWRERRWEANQTIFLYPENWLTVGPPDSIPDKCARIVTAPDGERIAVFRDGNQIGALTNVCAHQNGPIGEGRIINGCVTCPWHGYEYRLDDGCAPPPFTEKLATYRLRLRDGVVEVDPQALAPGTKAAITL